jgi:16S rRNA A1518/A1519 N6-dimethyltransferase RsmA/KsgA/DIM1 with predicted DNA glycosylase/AP lyase activity
MTLTFQKEVAERIVAPPRDKQRCRLSLMSQAWCDVDLKFLIKGDFFNFLLDCMYMSRKQISNLKIGNVLIYKIIK